MKNEYYVGTQYSSVLTATEQSAVYEKVFLVAIFVINNLTKYNKF